MAGYNKTILIGNCVRQPELRYTPSGTAVTDFPIAVNRVYGSGEGRKEETLFIDVQAWGKSAETLSRYLTKGAPILIEGRLVLDQWESGGEKRSKIKVVSENFQFLPKSSGPAGVRGDSGTEQAPPDSDDEDDVPF